ncbi:MAG: YraN family protein [Bacillota bacterium]
MTQQRRRVGMAGEQAARVYLENIGYEIIETNYRCTIGEIDIIAREGKTLVFVEVRTKTGTAYGRPEESIDLRKARQLRRLVFFYLQQKKLNSTSCRLDLIAVMLDKKEMAAQELKHLKGILSR